MAITYVVSGGVPPNLDPADLSDVLLLIFDYAEDQAALGATGFTAQDWVSSDPVNAVLGDGVATVTRVGTVITPYGEVWRKRNAVSGVYENSTAGLADAVGIGLTFVSAGTYRIESQVAISDGAQNLAFHRSVNIVVNANM